MQLPVNKPCLLAIRPEAITVSNSSTGNSADNQLTATIEQIEFSGATTTLTLNANDLRLEVLMLRADELRIGEECRVTLPPDRIRILPE